MTVSCPYWSIVADQHHACQIILDFIHRLKVANFARLNTLSLTRDFQFPSSMEGLAADTLPEDTKAFRPFMEAVHDPLPTVVDFTVSCGRTVFYAKRVDPNKSLEDGGWWVSTVSLILSQVPV